MVSFRIFFKKNVKNLIMQHLEKPKGTIYTNIVKEEIFLCVKLKEMAKNHTKVLDCV